MGVGIIVEIERTKHFRRGPVVANELRMQVVNFNHAHVITLYTVLLLLPLPTNYSML